MAALVATPNQAGGYVSLAGSALGVATANVYRIDVAGNEVLVRNGDPITVSAGLFTTQDYEAPLDVSVDYEVRNVSTGAVIASDTAVILPSIADRAWLGHPGKPSYNMTVLPKTFVPSTRRARAATFPVIGSSLPIAQSLRRSGYEGILVVKIAEDSERLALDTLLDDGAVLLLRGPASWPTMGHRYLQIQDTEYEPATRVLTDERAKMALPWIQVSRPTGLAQAGPGFRWADVISTYATWADVMSANPTWADVMDGVP
jgi:hypothetical protein